MVVAGKSHVTSCLGGAEKFSILLIYSVSSFIANPVVVMSFDPHYLLVNLIDVH